MIKDLKIGDVIGIYEVLNTAAQPAQDGHKQIHVRCIQCGLEKDIRPVNLGAKLCNHNCNLRFGQIQSSHLKIHKKTLDDLFTDFGADYKIISDKTYEKKVIAGKAVQQRLLAEGIHKGWQSRNITSYAEQFWMQVLDNNSIEYQREVTVKHNKSNYFLDFVIEHNGKLIDLEIDGKQHQYQDRARSDQIRDKYLTDLGYRVYRISWNEIKSSAGKQLIEEKIDAFLTYYNQLVV